VRNPNIVAIAAFKSTIFRKLKHGERLMYSYTTSENLLGTHLLTSVRGEAKLVQ